MDTPKRIFSVYKTIRAWIVTCICLQIPFAHFFTAATVCEESIEAFCCCVASDRILRCPPHGIRVRPFIRTFVAYLGAQEWLQYDGVAENCYITSEYVHFVAASLKLHACFRIAVWGMPQITSYQILDRQDLRIMTCIEKVNSPLSLISLHKGDVIESNNLLFW